MSTMSDDRYPTVAQLGAALRADLDARGVSLREAEAEYGISKATLSRVCRGWPMSVEVYRTIAQKIWSAAN